MLDDQRGSGWMPFWVKYLISRDCYKPKKDLYISHTWRLSEQLWLRFTTLIMPHLRRDINENNRMQRWCICWPQQIKVTIDTNGSASSILFCRNTFFFYIIYEAMHFYEHLPSKQIRSKKSGFKANWSSNLPTRGWVTTWKEFNISKHFLLGMQQRRCSNSLLHGAARGGKKKTTYDRYICSCHF